MRTPVECSAARRVYFSNLHATERVWRRDASGPTRRPAYTRRVRVLSPEADATRSQSCQ